MFRSRNRCLPAKNGDTVIAVGSVGVYEPNGEYQLYVEVLFPQGIGELHRAFEQPSCWKRRGFSTRPAKVPLPLLPRRVGVITSPSGAPGISCTCSPGVILRECAGLSRFSSG